MRRGHHDPLRGVIGVVGQNPRLEGGFAGAQKLDHEAVFRARGGLLVPAVNRRDRAFDLHADGQALVDEPLRELLGLGAGFDGGPSNFHSEADRERGQAECASEQDCP